VGLFPYPPRPFQEVAAKIVADVALAKGHLVLEMPTGSGKTAVLLSGALEAALQTGRRVLYVSRTHTQQEQTIKEFNQIREKFGLEVQAYALQGRSRLCLKLEELADPEWAEAAPDELSQYCSKAKAETDRHPQASAGCRFWGNLQTTSDESLQSWAGPGARTAEWLRAAARERGICPYEMVKRLLPRATLVVAPYVFAFDLGLRRRLLEWWGVQESDLILVVDEAHNVPGYLRESSSPRVSRERLRRCLSEAQELGNPEVARGLLTKGFLEGLASQVDELVGEYCKEEDGFVPPFEFETGLMERFSISTRTILEIANTLRSLGEAYKDRRRLLGRIPRSHLAHLATFLRGWLESDEEGFVKLAGREPQRYLEAFLVDCTRLSDRFTAYSATIHASGTLEPLQEYRDALGLPAESRLERFPSPFASDALRIECVSGVTTKYETLKQDPSAVDRLQDATRRVLEALSVKSACFFPSHRLLQEFQELGLFAGLPAEPRVEAVDLSSAQVAALLEDHRRALTSLLVGVLGGRLSEGLDFPGRQLEAMVIVGMPFPKPTAHQRALFHYFEVRFGRGWDYAVRAPTLRRVRQALGRLIRGPDDRGFAVILDDRAAAFLQSAGIEAETGSIEDVARRLREWQTAQPVPSARYA
jgi:DNA excision repair protein ERCC-2